MDIQNDRQTVGLIYSKLLYHKPAYQFLLSQLFHLPTLTSLSPFLKFQTKLKQVKRIYNFQGFQTSGTLEGPYYRGACLRGAY